MNLIEPKTLKPGNTIAIIAPAGVVDAQKTEKAKVYFEEKGYNVKLGSHIYNKNCYLAGEDDERLEDLHNAFSDSSVDAIICARGGYGAIRLINKIDYEIIKNNPKIFCGYSDITALSLMFLKRAGLVTYSGPMAQSDFGMDEIDGFTQDAFFETLTTGNAVTVPENKWVYHKGCADGILWGGNLSTIVSLCGQDFIPDEKFIFFAEDLNESAYSIDRLFTQLLNIDKFKKHISALLLGDFLDVDEPVYLDSFFKNLAAKLEIPVIAGYPFTHEKEKATVPVGKKAHLDVDGTLTV